MFGSKIKKSDETDDQPDQLAEQLENLHFEARPQFQYDLKARLMNQLANQPVKNTNAFRLPRFTLARSFGLVLAGSGLAAVLVILIAVLNAPGAPTAQDTTAVAFVPSAMASAQAQPSQTTAPAQVTNSATVVSNPPTASQPTVVINDTGIKLYNASSQSYLSPAEASQKLGIPLEIPANLPANYQLKTADLQVVPDKPATNLIPTGGYYLEYSAQNAGQAEESLEISQWKVPFAFGPGSMPGGPLGNIVKRPNGGPNVLGADNVVTTTVKGQPAYFIQGNRWRMQFPGMAGKGPGQAAPSTEAPETPEGPFQPLVNPKDRANLPVVIGRTRADRPDYFVEFGGKDNAKNTRSVVWQQDSVLNVVTASDGVGDDQLKQVAGSLAPVGKK